MAKDIDDGESPDETICPFGHEAVTLTKEAFLDYVQIGIRPAARITDDVTKSVGYEYEYYLVVSDIHTDREWMSEGTVSWQKAISLRACLLIQEFVGSSRLSIR